MRWVQVTCLIEDRDFLALSYLAFNRFGWHLETVSDPKHYVSKLKRASGAYIVFACILCAVAHVSCVVSHLVINCLPPSAVLRELYTMNPQDYTL